MREVYLDNNATTAIAPEVREAMEPFGKGQTGSSSMPHKKNPILTENVTGFARLLRGLTPLCFEGPREYLLRFRRFP